MAQRSVLYEVTTPETQLRERLFSYDPDGNITGIQDTLRGDIQCDYDPEGRLKRHLSVHWAVSRREFGYDAADNLLDTATTAPLTDNRLRKWRDLWSQYDGQGNLIRCKRGATEQHYRYDALGGTVTFDWNQQVLLTASVDTLDNVTRRECDARGRLAKVVYPGGSRESLSWNARGPSAVSR